MGRPPLKAATRTVKTTVRMDQPTIDRIVALVGENQMARFIREAVDGELQRREREKAKGAR